MESMALRNISRGFKSTFKTPDNDINDSRITDSFKGLLVRRVRDNVNRLAQDQQESFGNEIATLELDDENVVALIHQAYIRGRNDMHDAKNVQFGLVEYVPEEAPNV